MNRPSFDSTIAALGFVDTRFEWVHPTDEELDVVAVLEVIAGLHQPVGDEPCAWGDCGGCLTPWPCAEWQRGEQLGLLYLGRGADRYVAHARQASQKGAVA